MTDQADLKTYRGNCHCGAYVFEVKLPELTIVDQCNCSVCYKKGVLFAFPEPGNLTFVKGDQSTLTSYTFNKNLLHHTFCPTCGTSLMCVGNLEAAGPDDQKEPEMGLNVRTLQGVDVWSLETRLFDGAALPPPYQGPEFLGTLPQAELDGGQLVTGSCHCGAIRVALKTKPLDKDYEAGLIDCNCSSCSRYGTAWMYAKLEHVAIEGEENASYYRFGTRIFHKMFCRTCGVVIGNKAAELSEKEIAGLSEEAKKWFSAGRTICGMNAKVLNGVDLGPVKVKKVDGWNLAMSKYVNP